MSITKYTNFDSIDINKSNQGEFLMKDDKFIVTKNEVEETDFGDCKYDVMEVSVYDINNNLLPHKSGKNVAYIKTGDIKNYLYNLTNKGGQPELAIDIKKLLNDLGFSNGILKVIINFVRNRVGTDNELTRVWIQQISPSREEIRVLPLKTSDTNVNKKTESEFTNINNLSKDFKYYRKNILTALDSFEVTYLDSITDAMTARFGKDFESVLRKDFGLSDFNGFKKRIFSDFKDSVTYWVTNKYYNVAESNFGKPSNIRFEDCEQYDFSRLLGEIYSILRNCIDYHTKTLKRRDISIKSLPKEFEITELKKEVRDLVGNIKVDENRVRNVYNPKQVEIKSVGTKIIDVKKEVIKILPDPIKEEPIFDLPPNPPEKEEPIKIEPIKIEPIKIIPPDPIIKIDPIKEEPIKEEPIKIDPIKIIPPDPIIKIDPIKEEPIKEDPIKIPIVDLPPFTGGGGGVVGGGGSGGGGGTVIRERGTGLGREVVYDDDVRQRENIQ